MYNSRTTFSTISLVTLMTPVLKPALVHVLYFPFLINTLHYITLEDGLFLVSPKGWVNFCHSSITTNPVGITPPLFKVIFALVFSQFYSVTLTPLSIPPARYLSLPGLPADIKWVCEKLKRLDLSHNRLHSLPDTFTDLRRLNVLMLSHNSLKELPPSCSWGCINLVSLSREHHVINDIHSLSAPLTMSPLLQVQLDCTMNQLTDLPIGCANNWMHSLERLHLAHNRFSQISRNITELTHLTVLDLSHNHISSLPPVRTVLTETPLLSILSL